MSSLDRTRPPAPASVRQFEFPAMERSQLANGLAVLTAQHGTVPLATARVVLDAGVRREGGELAGLAHLVAHTIDTGTTKRDARALSWELEHMGAQLEVATGFDATAIAVTAPSERMDSALALLAEIISDARFPETEVQRVRNEQLGELEQRSTDPRSLASDQAVRFIYGAGATYGRPPLGQRQTVERLTTGDVRAFYHDRYSPRTSALILVGALDEGTRTAASTHFANWTSEPAPILTLFEGRAWSPLVVHLVDRPGSVQSEIRLGHAGPTRADPDFFSLQVLNSILGGAFTSRLNMNLRERHGFTYGVRSAFTFRKGHGPFLISTAVASDVTARAIEETLKEVDLLRAEGPTDAEIRDTRDYLAGILPLELQTTNQLAGRLSELFIYDLPETYFQNYRARIAEVTRDDVHRAAQQHIDRDSLTITVVGAASQIEKSLRDLELGPVEVHATDV